MADLKKMTLESLRELARKVLGPGHSRKTKGELIDALQKAARGPEAPAREAAPPTREPGGRPAGVASRAARVAKVARQAGQAARDGARAVARAGKAAADAAAVGAAAGAKEAAKATRARRGGKVASAVAAVAGAAAGAAAGVAAARKAAKGRRTPEGPDPEGYFVARVRGEDAVREAPHPMTETADDRWTALEEGVGPPHYDERLGDLPLGYGDDALVALPRDPRTLFLYWDHARDTLARGFEGLDHPRVQLWVFGRAGAGWERVRAVDFALESRGYYVHELQPGRTYRAEIHAVDRAGHERLLGVPSNEVTLPPVGPSPLVDDRFIRIPWELPLGKLLGPGHAGGPFSDEARAMLARLSDWSRFSGTTWGGSAGGMGGRPFSPTSSPSRGGER
jgi:hypothetical protein